MQTESRFGRCRVVHASIPSAILTAKLCLTLEQRSDTADILVLTLDNYTGKDIEGYEESLRILADGYPWAGVYFWNGNRESLESTGRILPPKSKSGRVYNWYADTRLYRQWMKDLTTEIGYIRGGRNGDRLHIPIEEIWVDAATAPSRFLLNSNPSARKVLFPHAVNWEVHQIPPGWFRVPWADHGDERNRWRTFIKRTIAKWGPLTLATRLKWGVPLERAYAILDFPTPSPNVVDVSSIMTGVTFNRLCSHLRSDVQDYFRSIGGLGPDGRPCILVLLPAHDRPQDFEAEVALLLETFVLVSSRHSHGPVILKPHPRGSERYVQAIKAQLEPAGYQCRVLNRWASIPVELVAGLWNLTVCVGLFTSALLTLCRLHSIPAYCPVEKAKQIYSDDDNLSKCAAEFIAISQNYLTWV